MDITCINGNKYNYYIVRGRKTMKANFQNIIVNEMQRVRDFASLNHPSCKTFKETIIVNV